MTERNRMLCVRSVSEDGSGRWALRNVERGYFLGSSADKLTCTAKAPGDAELWHVHLAARPQVNLRSIGRKRFAHLSEAQDEIHVDANVPWGEDTLFTLEFRADEGGKYALHTCNNKYLSNAGKFCIALWATRDTCQSFCRCNRRGAALNASDENDTAPVRALVLSRAARVGRPPAISPLDTNATLVCEVCGAEPSNINNLTLVRKKHEKEETFRYGLSTLLDACTPACLFSAEYHAGALALRDAAGAYLAPIGSKAVLKTRSTGVTRDELFSLEDSLPQAAFVAALNDKYVSVKQGQYRTNYTSGREGYLVRVGVAHTPLALVDVRITRPQAARVVNAQDGAVGVENANASDAWMGNAFVRLRIPYLKILFLCVPRNEFARRGVVGEYNVRERRLLYKRQAAGVRRRGRGGAARAALSRERRTAALCILQCAIRELIFKELHLVTGSTDLILDLFDSAKIKIILRLKDKLRRNMRLTRRRRRFTAALLANVRCHANRRAPSSGRCSPAPPT
ncbi:Protein singed [Eumeta japonica]|uniref:Protein singed n=1 Tax=Eumeta variegata TaxID=151549 RepID=A0A4C1UXY8_EUMVA|nr:Protein singed [Eumeta japonica]